MKHIIKILVLIFVIYVFYALTAQASGRQTNDDPQAEITGNTEQIEPQQIDDPDDPSPDLDDEDYFSYDQDILSRKLYEKKLSPLSPKEKIIWSFRLAETNTFL